MAEWKKVGTFTMNANENKTGNQPDRRGTFTIEEYELVEKPGATTKLSMSAWDKVNSHTNAEFLSGDIQIPPPLREEPATETTVASSDIPF